MGYVSEKANSNVVAANRLIPMHEQPSLYLKNGLSIQVVSNGGKSKIIFFDRPIRGVELTGDECSRLSDILAAEDRGPRPMTVLHELLTEGYFKTPRDLSSIRHTLLARGSTVQPSVLSVLLGQIVQRKELERSGSRRGYSYVSVSLDHELES